MALALGTNSGFCAVAPTADPGGSNGTIDGVSGVTKHTSPTNATKIVGVGWWCDTATEAADFAVALYAADGTVVPGEAHTRLYVSSGNAKGTTSGWKHVVVDWPISPGTAYWIGVGCNNTATTTSTNTAATGGAGYDQIISGLTNPISGGTLTDSDGMYAFYAVYTAHLSLTATSFTLSGVSAAVLFGRKIVSSVGTIALTGFAMAMRLGRKITADVSSFTLTGVVQQLRKSFLFSIGVAEFILTGINATLKPRQSIFTNTTKNTATFTNKTKNTASFANMSKSTTTFTNKTKNAATFTNTSKNTTTFTNKEKS